MKEIELHWHPYKYFNYERLLGLREVESILAPSLIEEVMGGLRVKGDFRNEHIKRLVYFSFADVDNKRIPTIQYQLERSQTNINGKKRQTTRYSVHGLHEYKGKFNPQIVNAIFNLCNVKQSDKILDPFCGSGTSLSEAIHSGLDATGVDINPLAVYISNAKILALNIPAKKLKDAFKEIFDIWTGHNGITLLEKDERTQYLAKWLPGDTHWKLEKVKRIIEDCEHEYQQIFLALISDMIRDYSLQEPADLRNRKRKSSLPSTPFESAVKKKVELFLNNLESAQEVLESRGSNGKAILIDNRKRLDQVEKVISRGPFDFAITRPPYAMALPYIDTQRLSLVWLNLCKPIDINPLEASLVGSREFRNGKKNINLIEMNGNHRKLPKQVLEFCLKLQSSLSYKDGFRRQAVPTLLYRYLADMRDSFISVKRVLKKGGQYGLIIGYNSTTLGGIKYKIDTPIFLKILAEDTGWKTKELLDLETYKRYDIHRANSINREALLILENNA